MAPVRAGHRGPDDYQNGAGNDSKEEDHRSRRRHDPASSQGHLRRRRSGRSPSRLSWGIVMRVTGAPVPMSRGLPTRDAVDPTIQAGQAGRSESQAGRFTLPLCSPIWNLPSLLCHDAATACGWVLRSGRRLCRRRDSSVQGLPPWKQPGMVGLTSPASAPSGWTAHSGLRRARGPTKPGTSPGTRAAC